MSFLKIIVCGGRDFQGKGAVFKALDALCIPHGENEPRPGTHIAQGGATGADSWARLWAVERRLPLSNYTADWGRYGRAAGPIRNAYMLGDFKPDLVLAFPGGKGTMGMINLAAQAGVGVVMYDHGGDVLQTIEP